MYNVCIRVYNRVYMKIRINITIDETAVELLNEQPNKSQYIEDLILNSITDGEPDSGLTEQRVREIIKEELQDSNAAETFTPKPPDPITGYPCCSKATPCKHWSWDDGAWKNSLTGATREVL